SKQGAKHDHRALRISAEPARLQGDGGRQSPRPRLEFVDLRKGDPRSPEFAALNPNMRMPVLKDGNYVLWESSAIAQYLALRRPDAGLFPAEERARLDIARWQFWDHAHWDPACSIFAFEYVVKSVV